jgi:hypothetical protein
MQLKSKDSDTADGLPVSGTIMTACQVLTWWAFGEPQIKERFAVGQVEILDRWGTTRLGVVLEALIARVAPAPFCPLAHLGEGRFYGDILLSPKGPRHLRAIRARARKRTGRLVSYQDLLEGLQADLGANQEEEELVEAATNELLRAVRTGKIIAHGE